MNLTYGMGDIVDSHVGFGGVAIYLIQMMITRGFLRYT